MIVNNHMCDIAFAVLSINAGEGLTPEEFLAWLKRRVAQLEAHPDELLEVTANLPSDSFEEVVDLRKPFENQNLSPACLDFLNDGMVIYSKAEAESDGKPGFWSNSMGWVDIDSATVFSTAAGQWCQQGFNLPISSGQDATWVKLTEVHHLLNGNEG